MSHNHNHHSHNSLSLDNLQHGAEENRKRLSNEKYSEDEYELAWATYSRVRNKISDMTQKRIMEHVLEHIPEACFVVLYEDRSHDAPHGHCEGIYSCSGEELLSGTSDTWHDLDWTSDIDEFIWDVYHVSSDRFTTLGGVRRLVITASEEHPDDFSN